MLGEGQYAELQRPLEFDDHTLALCHLAALNARDKVEESGKRSESLTKIIQSPKEAFNYTLQRLTSAVNRIVLLDGIVQCRTCIQLHVGSSDYPN